MQYQPAVIEPKWQKFWQEKKVFEVTENASLPKYYCLDMFPYPSSSGLHVGHPEGYTASDIMARYKRCQGFNVLHPMGWDAFGLPAEQYAIKSGIHPEQTTKICIQNFKRQLQALGFSFDWSREITTCDPKYYQSTQYIFTLLYQKGLAYQKEVPVNWCPALKTVLANEEVIQGKSERGNHPVYRLPMKQWMLKITAYAEKLLKDLEQLDWPESTKQLQRNWIGKSEGALVKFTLDTFEPITVFTTRIDTLYGVTFLALAPEHPFIQTLANPFVQTYCKQALQKSEVMRQEAELKTGVFTGCYAKHPLLDKKIPIWVADYVLMDYGSGAIMGVPGHDERDFAFAQTFDLPSIVVIDEKKNQLLESDIFTGLSCQEAKEKILQKLIENHTAEASIQYKLRDWLFSRQRYWGEPFPIGYFEGQPQVLPAELLPVTLPTVPDYEPGEDAKSPLDKAVEWKHAQDLNGNPFIRETDTMPGSAASSWYFLKFCNPFSHDLPYDPVAVHYWMPVDLYIGGPEHAVGHLLYARFWTKVLFDLGLCPVDEPFKKLVHQGMILGTDGEKMSKSRGNVINPDEIIAQYGADTLRVFLMFLGPLEKDKPWSSDSIEGVYRFLQRAYRLRELCNQQTPELESQKILHQTILKVTQDIEQLRFNTAISQLMICVNYFTKQHSIHVDQLNCFIQLLHPFAPHLAEEMWEQMGNQTLLAYTPWPQYDLELAKQNMIFIAVQILGKTRGTVEVIVDASQEDVLRCVYENPAFKKHFEAKTVQKIIFVPNKIINFIIR